MTTLGSGAAVDKYLNFDISSGSRCAQTLLERVQGEAASAAPLPLTAMGDDNALSGGLTPAMSQWLATSVTPIRGPALAELEGEARGIKIGNNVDGLLLEAEIDRADRYRAKRTQQIVSDFNRDNKRALEKYHAVSEVYNKHNAEVGGREAKTPSKWLEFGLLIPIVMIPEAMLNFESFRRAPIIQSDAMALGATVLVGFGIATAAYCIGLFVRQFSYYSEPDNDARQRSGWPLWTFGALALLVSLGSVAVARYYYLLPKIQEAIVLGGPVPNVPVSVGSLLFGNLICFLVGAVITFFLNDENPAYADSAEAQARLGKKIAKLKRRRVDAQLDRINAATKLKGDAAATKAGQMKGRPGYTQMRERMDLVLVKDAEVVGVLENYRIALVQANPHIQFEKRVQSADDSDPTKRMGATEFAGARLQLNRSP